MPLEWGDIVADSSMLSRSSKSASRAMGGRLRLQSPLDFGHIGESSLRIASERADTTRQQLKAFEKPSRKEYMVYVVLK
jgi:hypothetical protein